MKKANVKTLGYGFSLGARNVPTKHLLKTAEDLHGVKVRVLRSRTVATLKAMGAAADSDAFRRNLLGSADGCD